MKQTATAFLIVSLGVMCISASGYAAERPGAAGLRLSLSSTAPPPDLLSRIQAPDARSAPYLDPSPQQGSSQRDSFASIAYKISYVGSILLTADQVVRSVDSVMDSMKLRAPDGAVVRFDMRPDSKGFEMMLRVSRPL
jgi:hypothetical protein